jgi:hypothetical protein
MRVTAAKSTELTVVTAARFLHPSEGRNEAEIHFGGKVKLKSSR